MTELPPGFKTLEPMDRVMQWIGPLYIRVDGQHVALGFRVDHHHCNPQGNCHGGIWGTFADLQLGLNVVQVTGMGGPTISLTLDFLDAAKLGAWVEGRTQFLKRTRNMAFVQCIATADGMPAIRANATFRPKWQRLPRT